MPRPTKPSPAQTVRSLVASIAAMARREMALLCILLLAAGGIWGFIAIADELVEGELTRLDTTLLLALRNPADSGDPLGPAWLEEAARQITALGGFATASLIATAATVWLLLRRQRGAAVLVAVSVGSGAMLSSLLKNAFARARPDLVPHGDIVHSLSFPSGHAMSSAIIYLTLGALLARAQPQRRLKIFLLSLAVLLTLLIGLSRVYLGVHWPSDVLAGWCIGSAWALLWWAVALWWTRTRPRSG